MTAGAAAALAAAMVLVLTGLGLDHAGGTAPPGTAPGNPRRAAEVEDGSPPAVGAQSAPPPSRREEIADVIHGVRVIGTTAHVAPSTGTIGILLTQLQMTGPTPTQLMREFWQYAFSPLTD